MNVIILASQNRNYLPVDEWLSDFNGVLNLFIKDFHYETYKSLENHHNINLFTFKNWDTNWNIEKAISKFHSENKINKIIAISEKDIQRAAIIRENLNIEGQNVESANFFRDKHTMKSLLNKKNILTPNFKLVTNYYDLDEFISSNNYPIILKPTDGSSSINTYKINDEKELEDVLIKNNCKGYIVEKYIEGQIYHIDGLWLSNSLEFLSCSKYINDSLAYKEGRSSSSIFLKRTSEMFKNLAKYTNKLLSLIPTPNSMAFHLEVFVNSDMEIIFCEIASRTGGGQIANNIEMEFGFHLTKELFRHECNLDTFNFDHIKNSDWELYRGFIMSTPLVGRIDELPRNVPFDWVTKIEKFGKKGNLYSSLNSSVHCVAAISCAAKTEKELCDRLEVIDKWYKQNTKYSAI
ncbi:MAG: ATP-grasp domain-containing protein [Bacillota bacterium]